MIVVVAKNNGPDPIPTGEATCQITLSNKHLTFPRNHDFRNIGDKQWSFLGAKRNAPGQVNLFFQNNAGEIPVNNEDVSGFSFEVQGKSVTKSPTAITVASSLSATAKSSDIDGSNQSASTELTVLPKRKYTKTK